MLNREQLRREQLQKEISELTDLVKYDEAAVRSLTTTANRDLLLQAIAVRKQRLAALKAQLASLRHS
jgi:predicted DNA-binding ArsR family transcriptional regulator